MENKLGKTLWGFDKVLCFGIMPGLTFYNISKGGMEYTIVRSVKRITDSNAKTTLKEEISEQAK